MRNVPYKSLRIMYSKFADAIIELSQHGLGVFLCSMIGSHAEVRTKPGIGTPDSYRA
jgi:hypothetical protein